MRRKKKGREKKEEEEIIVLGKFYDKFKQSQNPTKSEFYNSVNDIAIPLPLFVCKV